MSEYTQKLTIKVTPEQLKEIKARNANQNISAKVREFLLQPQQQSN